MKLQTWKEIADDAREVGRRLAAYAFAGRPTGWEFNQALNFVRGVLLCATSRRRLYSKSTAMDLNARGYDFCYQIGAEG